VKSVRVCMVTYAFPPVYSGAGAQALQLAGRLQEKDIAVTILTARHTSNLPVQELVHRVPVNRLSVLCSGRLRPFSFSAATAWHLLLHHQRYDVIHIHGAYWRILPELLVARLTARRSVVKMTQLGTDDPQTIRRRRLGRVLYRTLALADAVISTSHDLTLSYRRSGLPPDKLIQIPNGVDTALFHPVDDTLRRAIRSRLNLPQDTQLVVFIGRIGYRKGVDTLLRAWATVVEKHPDAWLVLVGPIGGDGPILAAKPPIERQLQETSQTLALGYQTNVQDYLQAADAFVLPTRLEGLPNALLEAMAAGLPCIASDIGGNTDLITDEKNGLLFEAEDVEQLISALLRLLNDDAERHMLGRCARETVKANYSMDQVAEKYVILYHRMLERGVGGQL
jgi:glycosyltransferase involved in cell wall biosynthesis